VVAGAPASGHTIPAIRQTNILYILLFAFAVKIFRPILLRYDVSVAFSRGGEVITAFQKRTRQGEIRLKIFCKVKI